MALRSLFAPRAILHRLNILKLTFQDHQFERTSPLPSLPPHLYDRIYSELVVLPPRNVIEKPGAQTLEGLVFLASLVAAVSARSIFEFGTFTGATTWALARNAPGSMVETLDLPPDETPQLPLEETDEIVRNLSVAHIYNELPHDAQIRQLWGDSATFDYSGRSDRFDFVYIDGAHSEPYVRSDTENAFAMLQDPGVVVWDDYWREVSGVRTVLHDLDGLKLYRIPRTRLVVHLTPKMEEQLAKGAGPLWRSGPDSFGPEASA